ncbi:MAG: hypothetical protein Q9190_004979 [Brigantiaea leucoxantha]
MDNSSDFFSSEALQLIGADLSWLDVQASGWPDSSKGSHSDGDHDVPIISSTVFEGRHKVLSSQPEAVPGTHTFSATTELGPRRKRAKFEDPKRRADVAQGEHTELFSRKAIHWEINTLSTDFATWMAMDGADPAATSRVGILSSTDFQSLLRHYLDEDLCMNMRLLVRTSSLLYNRTDPPHPCCSREQLVFVSTLAGNGLLKNLESALKAGALAQASKEKLSCLFLVLFGAVIAITYTTTVEELEEARHELLRILTHHLVLIGERIGLLDCDLTKQRLTEGSHVLWNKTGIFGWTFAYAESLTAAYGFTDYYGYSTLDRSDLEHSGFSAAKSLNNATRKPVTGHSSRRQLAEDSAYGWSRSSVFDHSSLRILETCWRCNKPFHSNEKCPTCTGPSPITANDGDAKVKMDFDLMLQTRDIEETGSVASRTETRSIQEASEVLQSDLLSYNSSLRLESGIGGAEASEYFSRSSTPAEKDILPSLVDRSDQNSGSLRSTYKKRTLKPKKIPKKAKSEVRKLQKSGLKILRSNRKVSTLANTSRHCLLCGVVCTPNADFQCSYCPPSRISYKYRDLAYPYPASSQRGLI